MFRDDRMHHSSQHGLHPSPPQHPAGDAHSMTSSFRAYHLPSGAKDGAQEQHQQSDSSQMSRSDGQLLLRSISSHVGSCKLRSIPDAVELLKP